MLELHPLCLNQLSCLLLWKHSQQSAVRPMTSLQHSNCFPKGCQLSCCKFSFIYGCMWKTHYRLCLAGSGERAGTSKDRPQSPLLFWYSTALSVATLHLLMRKLMQLAEPVAKQMARWWVSVRWWSYFELAGVWLMGGSSRVDSER